MYGRRVPGRTALNRLSSVRGCVALHSANELNIGSAILSSMNQSNSLASSKSKPSNNDATLIMPCNEFSQLKISRPTTSKGLLG